MPQPIPIGWNARAPSIAAQRLQRSAEATGGLHGRGGQLPPRLAADDGVRPCPEVPEADAVGDRQSDQRPLMGLPTCNAGQLLLASSTCICSIVLRCSCFLERWGFGQCLPAKCVAFAFLLISEEVKKIPEMFS